MVRRDRSSTARPGRRRKVLLGALGAVMVLALTAAGYGWWTYRKVDRIDVDLAAPVDNEPRNYLIVGSDSRESVSEDDPNAALFHGDEAPGGQRSDSISILRVDPGENRIDVLGIPRDLWVTLPDGSEQRINAAYAESTQTLIDTIDENLGIPIHHFVEVDFAGFQQLIDAIDGVPMYFDAPVRDPNSGLEIDSPGCAVLNGAQGLAFARSRHLEYRGENGWESDPTGDLGRITRQQLLMRAALAKIGSLGLDDVGRLNGLVNAGLESVTVDSGLGFGDILGLGQRFSNFDPQRLQTHQLAVTPDRTDGGASIVRLDEAASAETLAFFRGSQSASPVTTTTTPPIDTGDVNVTIYNGGGVQGEARRVSYAFDAGGFSIGFVETAQDKIAQTEVRYPKGSKNMGELVGSWLGPEPTLVEDEDLGSGQVVVTLGRDFETVGEPTEQPDGGDSDPATTERGATGDSAAGEVTTSTTTTTTMPGWTPGVAPEGVRCA